MKKSQEPLLTRVLLVAGYCAVLVIPLMAYGCGPEWARWDAAQAMMAHEQGNVEGAIDQLTAAVEKSPRDPSLKLSLAEKLIESNQPFRAERMCDEILKRFPDHDAALIRKVNSQQAQGNFGKALDTFKQRAKARSWLISDSYLKLNERAYYRALANQELENAKDDIDAAISKIARSSLGTLDHSVTIIERSLVASALIGRQIGLADQAVNLLTPRINFVRAAAHEQAIMLNAAVIEQSSIDVSPTEEDTRVYNALRSTLRLLEKTLALMLTTRALCYQDLARTGSLSNELSYQDRAEVKSLGLDSDAIATKLPGDNECIYELMNAHSLLDTRGFVVMRLQQQKIGLKEAELMESQAGDQQRFKTALADFNQSIFAYRVLAESLGTKVHNHIENTLDPTMMKLRIPRNKAVLFYHRMLLLELMGESAAAEKDRLRVRQLGFEPGWHLF